jgi:16S rRNA C967 or C1407 C5-methylase (RsmB/RsmF family)/NOL1/NOP2/fmu family ribosome biogenesis protein
MSELLGTAYADFLKGYELEEPASIRLHPVKGQFVQWNAAPIAWEPLGAILQQRPLFALDPAWHAGAYYVQESSSMLAAYVFKRYVQEERPMRVLDICAAPGGKSTHLLSSLDRESLLVSNEVIQKRNNILVENIQRWAYPNVVVSKNDVQDFAGLGAFFDCIIADVPCSGEGLFRRQPDAINEWSEAAVEHCVLRQKEILKAIIPALQVGGHLIYSTCTFEPAENENQVQYLVDSGEFELVMLQSDALPGVEQGFIPGTLRCWPHRTTGSGFFIALLRKIKHDDALHPFKSRHFWNWKQASMDAHKASAYFIRQQEELHILQSGDYLRLFPYRHLADLDILSSVLSIRHFGIDLGEMRKDIFLPSHGLSYSQLVHPDIPIYVASKEEALMYLRKQTLPVHDLPKGWAMVQYPGLNLGWIKHLGNRVNNYLPVEKMLRMQ